MTKSEPAARRSNSKRMHGEYKTPGGKLVVIDLTVVDGLLQDVQVSGDFFVYPDDAFPKLSEALDGLSSELSETEIAEQVRLALPRNAELLGTSPEAIGAAVRRALATEGDAQRG
jgi:lipoate-protein ligase A